MNIAKKSLTGSFLIGLFFTLFSPLLSIFSSLIFFSPFLILLYYQRSFSSCLWFSFGCGLLIDLISSKTPIGFFALCYVLSTVLIYNKRLYFFSDNLSTLCVMVIFFSIVNNGVQLLGLALIQPHFISLKIFTGYWIYINLFLIPILTLLYTFLLFIFPSLLLNKFRRR